MIDTNVLNISWGDGILYIVIAMGLYYYKCWVDKNFR